MGTNRRYPDLGLRLAEERELREARQHGPLQTLSEEQLSLDRRPVTIVPPRAQVWARAWIRFGDADIRATVRVLRWTDDAVGIGVTVDNEKLRAWIWRGACTVIESHAP